MANKNESFLWVHWVRVLATFGVVFLHTASPPLYLYNKISEEYWWIANVYDSMVRMCVPLFFMISGFLLLQKEYSLWTFCLKRFQKIFIPLLGWSVFFVLWSGLFEQSTSLSLYSFFKILYEPAYYHLWFLYALVGVYFSVPVLRVIIQNSDKTLLYYCLGLWFVAASLIPFAERISSVKSSYDFRLMSGLAGYLVLGWVLGNHSPTKKCATISCFMTVICVLITAFGTYFLTIRQEGLLSMEFYGPLAPNVVFLSVSVFVLIKYVVENYKFAENETILRVVHSVSSASFGIFLIHTVFLYLLRYHYLGVYLHGLRGNPLFWIPVTAFATFGLSYGAIYLLRLNHLTRRLAP